MKINFPAQICIIKNYKISGLKSYNCTKSTKFQAASVSKVLTALLVLRLVQEKKFGLNKDVNSYLKNHKVRNKNGDLVKVTLKQLLSHTAGINVSGFPGYSFNSKIPSLDQILSGRKPCNTDRIIVKFKPGRKYSYSGGGYMIIQKIIEDALNKKFEDLIKKKILKPLKMNNSDFNLRKLKKFRKYPEKAAAGLWTTAEDLGKLLIEIQRNSIKLMIKPLISAERNYMGLGIFIKKDKKGFYHTGHNYKFRNRIEGSINNGKGMIVLVNSNKIEDLKKIKKFSTSNSPLF